MTLRGTGKVLLATALLALGTSSVQAAAFTNGSFELGTDPGSMTRLTSGNTDITGWTVGGNDIDYVGTYWTAADGTRSIDLSGTGAGNIRQTFDTIAGNLYKVSFALAGNPDAGPQVKSLRVNATGGANQVYTFDSSGGSHSDLGWLSANYLFVASGSSTTLSFASLNEGLAGPAIDNVSVASVPEPATWAMMLIGFAGLGMVMRGRRTGRDIMHLRSAPVSDQ